MSAQDELPLIPDPLDSILQLVTKPVTSVSDKVAALTLVADSIAQQRQLAARAIIFHPFTVAVYILIVAMAIQFLYRSSEDIPMIVTTCTGITMTLLIGVRAWVGEYLTLAEGFNPSFLENDDGERDIIIGSRHGETIIGALILRIERSRHGNSKKKPKEGETRGKGLVRAWTTKQKYRGVGVGTELLEEAVRLTRNELGNSAEIKFADDHANSKMVLPEMFNQGFRKREARAVLALEAVIASITKANMQRR